MSTEPEIHVAGPAPQQAAWPGPGSPRSQFSPTIEGAAAPRVRLTLERLPQYSPPVPLAPTSSLQVSSPVTLSVRALQDVRMRANPQDFLDLAALQSRWGPEQFRALTVKILQHEESRAPKPDPAERYLELYHSLARVGQFAERHFTECGAMGRTRYAEPGQSDPEHRAALPRGPRPAAGPIGRDRRRRRLCARQYAGRRRYPDGGSAQPAA